MSEAEKSAREGRWHEARISVDHREIRVRVNSRVMVLGDEESGPQGAVVVFSQVV